MIYWKSGTDAKLREELYIALVRRYQQVIIIRLKKDKNTHLFSPGAEYKKATGKKKIQGFLSATTSRLDENEIADALNYVTQIIHDELKIIIAKVKILEFLI